MLTKEQQNFITQNVEIILTTSSEDIPRSIFVEASHVENDKIFITDNYMKISNQNLIHNPYIFILSTDKEYSKVINIQGVAKYKNEGEELEFIKGLESNKGFPCKGVIIVDIKDVKEMKE